MANLYYFLEGKESRGPYSIDEIKKFKLDNNTLIWCEGFENWKKLSEITDLKGIVPPPAPDFQNENQNNNLSDEINAIVVSSNAKSIIILKIVLIIIVLSSLVVISVVMFIEAKKESLKEEIEAKIEEVFNGKSSVIDGENYGVKGKLEETGYGQKEKNTKKNNDIIIKNTGSDWWDKGQLYTIFRCSEGGFTVKKLTKFDKNAFDLEMYYSTDMGYRIAKYSYTEPIYSPWGDLMMNGYKIENHRPSPQKCYDLAYDHLLEKDENGAYSPGKLHDISNFGSIANKYYSIENTEPTSLTSSAHTGYQWGSMDAHTANVYSDIYRVYYSSEGKHYELIEDSKVIKSDIFTLSIYSLCSLLLIVFVFFLFKPKFFRNLNLFEKKWQNTEDYEYYLMFKFSLFGKWSFIERQNKRKTVGKVRITNKGNIINLSYHDNETLYKIETVTENALNLISVINGQKLSFIRLGSLTEANTSTTQTTT